MPRKSAPAKEGGKRYPLNMRTTKALREWLDRAAAGSGRSLAQEVESIVEWRFHYDKLFRDMAGGQASRVIRPLVMFFGTIAAKASDWEHKPTIANALRESVAIIGEAAFSNRPISAQRQQEFLGPFRKARDRVPAEIVINALIVAQQFGLAEKFTLPPAKPATQKESTRLEPGPPAVLTTRKESA